MPRLLPPGMLIALLLLTTVSTGGSVAPAAPAALPFRHSQYNGRRLDLPGCNCTRSQNLVAWQSLVFTVRPSDNRWQFSIKYEDMVFYGTIDFDSATAATGRMTLTEVSYSQSDPRSQTYPGNTKTFDVTVKINDRDITIKQGGWCSSSYDRFCFIGRAPKR